jgi:Fe-S-cluster containining protein
VEAGPIDLLREPRINDVAPLKLMDRSQPVLDKCWILAGSKPCVFLENGRCAIYPTRPTACVQFPAGGAKCNKLREQAGLPPLRPTKADGSMHDRLVAELTAYEDDDDDF